MMMHTFGEPFAVLVDSSCRTAEGLRCVGAPMGDAPCTLHTANLSNRFGISFRQIHVQSVCRRTSACEQGIAGAGVILQHVLEVSKRGLGETKIKNRWMAKKHTLKSIGDADRLGPSAAA